MRNVAGLLAAVVLSFAAVYGQEKTAAMPMGEIEKVIVAQEEALYQAVAKQDRPSFQSLTIADGTWTTSSGFVPMHLLVDNLGAFRVSRFAIVNPHVKRLDADSALVIYVRTGEGTFGEQPFPRTALASTVWIKRDGRWRAMHHQETELSK